MLIFLGQTGLYLKRSMPFRATAVAAAVMYTVISTLLAYPNHLAYFNDFVGGPRNGHKHLLGSSLDWGQGTGEAIDWIQKHEPDSKVEISMWSQALATLLLNRPLDSTKSNSTDRAKSKLILYSADNFYGRRSTAVSNENSPQEEIIKQFESGNVLIRVQ